MKILKRNYRHINLMLFLGLSLIYLHAIDSLSRGVSLLSIDNGRTFFHNHSFVILIVLGSLYTVINVKRHSDKILLLCLTVLAGKNFIMLSESFNKLILILSFAYLIFAFYFFIYWELEINKASYNPLFSKNDLEKETRFPILAKIENDKGELISELRITNLDEVGCFALIIASNPSAVMAGLRSEMIYKLTAVCEGVSFVHGARLISTYDQGIGLDLLPSDPGKAQPNWSDLYKVCLERGLFS